MEETKSVFCLLELIPLPIYRQEVLAILRSVEGPTSVTPGCRSIQTYESSGEDAKVLLLEEWESVAQLTQHLRSSVYGRVLAAMELSGSPPVIRFCDISRIHGIELVKLLRGGQNNE